MSSYAGNIQVELLDFPHPYAAMLAISSDIDGTRLSHFNELHEFLSTQNSGRYGPGLNLDISDSFWLTNAHDVESHIRRYAVNRRSDSYTSDSDIALYDDFFCNKPSALHDYINELLASGALDTLHSIGNIQAFTRAEVLAADFDPRHLRDSLARRLNKFPAQIQVMTNHAQNPFNVGLNASFLGANARSDFYIADVLLDGGIRYIDIKENQGSPRLRTPLRRVDLPCGRSYWGFCRFTSLLAPTTEEINLVPESARRRLKLRPGRPVVAWRPELMALQLNGQVLDEIIQNHAAVVVAQHLGFVKDDGLPASCIDTLRTLKARQDAGQILITRTSRLLDYVRTRDHLEWDIHLDRGHCVIDIMGINDPVFGYSVPDLAALSGIQFQVTNSNVQRVYVRGIPVPERLLYRKCFDGVGGIVGVSWDATSARDNLPVVALPTDRTTCIRESYNEAAVIIPGEDDWPHMDFKNDYRLKALAELDKLESREFLNPAQAAHWSYAVDYARRRFEQPYEHYAEIFARLDISEGSRVLDLGSGLGDWTLALSRFGAVPTGIDKDSDYIDICSALCNCLSDADKRPRFLIGSAHQIDADDGCFDFVLCHGVMMFAEHELALREISRTLRPKGRLYVGYTGFAFRLRNITNWILAGNIDAATKAARILLNKFVFDCGIGAFGLGRVRMLAKSEFMRLAGYFGLDFAESPDVQDARGRFLGSSTTYDAIFERVGDPFTRTPARDELDNPVERIPKIITLVDIGAPLLAMEYLQDIKSHIGQMDYALLLNAIRLKQSKRPVALPKGSDMRSVLPNDLRALLSTLSLINSGTRSEDLQEALCHLADDHITVRAQALCLSGTHLLQNGNAEQAVATFTYLTNNLVSTGRFDASWQRQAGYTGALCAALQMNNMSLVTTSLAGLLTAFASDHLPPDKVDQAVSDTLAGRS